MPNGSEALAASGATPLIGSLTDIGVLRLGASAADGVIHTAFGLDHSKIEELSKEDRAAIETFGEVYGTRTARHVDDAVSCDA